MSAYGANARDSVSGWPTTTAAVGRPAALGPAPATVEQLVDVGRSVLQVVLER